MRPERKGPAPKAPIAGTPSRVIHWALALEDAARPGRTKARRSAFASGKPGRAIHFARTLRVAMLPLAALSLVSLATLAPAAEERAGADRPAERAAPAAGELHPLAIVAETREQSPVPKAAEWSGAKRVRLTRLGPAAAGCTASLVREWLRVRCPVKTFAVSQLGGSHEGLSFWIGTDSERPFAEVQLPLRRGDRRVVQLWTEGKDAEGAFRAEPGIVIQEHWVEGEGAPTVTAL